MHDDDLPETRLREQNSEYHYHNPYTPSGLIRRFTSGEWRIRDSLRTHRAPPPPTRIIIEDKRESSLVIIVLAAFFGSVMALMFTILIVFLVTHLPTR